MMLIDVKTKEELNIHMSQYGNHVLVGFGSKWALRNNYDNFYYLITFKEEPEVAISDEEAFSFIVKVRREESLNKILNDDNRS